MTYEQAAIHVYTNYPEVQNKTDIQSLVELHVKRGY